MRNKRCDLDHKVITECNGMPKRDRSIVAGKGGRIMTLLQWCGVGMWGPTCGLSIHVAAHLAACGLLGAGAGCSRTSHETVVPEMAEREQPASEQSIGMRSDLTSESLPGSTESIDCPECDPDGSRYAGTLSNVEPHPQRLGHVLPKGRSPRKMAFNARI